MMTPITYISEQPHDYARAIDDASTLISLQSVIAEWRSLAEDAWKIALAMKDSDFADFRAGLRLERRGKFAGEEWNERFADILMPAVMFKVSITANEYKVPWGLAYIRLKETGKLPA